MEFNSSQFRQPAMRGFGDQAMRTHRVTPARQPAPTPAPPPRAQGQQASLFQADEVRNPQGPQPSTFNANQFRISRPALPGMSTRSMARQRVTPSTPSPAPAPETSSGPRWYQPPITMLGPTASSPYSPGAAGPSPTHWPTPPPTPGKPPAPAPRNRSVDLAAHRAAGLRFGPEPAPPDPDPATSTRATAPPRPSTPPAMPSAQPTGPATADRAGAFAGLAVGLGARAAQSINKVATDPARSGNPLYKPTQGWSKS